MTAPERAAFRARTRQLFWLVILAGLGLSALTVFFKPPFLGTLTLLFVILGAFGVGLRYWFGEFKRDRVPPQSR